ncbi:MAG: N-acetylmuramoyl-L-alanine amidase, partial [Muribaculaceae bacterium]|nr:N-acetylmuramoyl-L-alanine amidase [Muribaculaceae bacterium]
MKKNILSFAFMLLAAVFGVNRAIAQEVPHVYINPGHGGHDSDDRNVVIPPFAQGDTLGFWESNSNLWKGFALKEILTKKGYQTSISRISNTTADDLALSTIVYLSNHSGADVFYSIHSNASGSGGATLVNFPM